MCVVYVWERRISKMDKHMSVEIAERDEERNTLHKMEWLKIKRCHCKPCTSTIYVVAPPLTQPSPKKAHAQSGSMQTLTCTQRA